MNQSRSSSVNRGSVSGVSRRHTRRHSTIVVPPPAGLQSSKVDTNDMPSFLVHETAVGASFLILLQVFSKLVTFILNQALLRFIPPARLGVASQLDLLVSSTLFFARESIRLALQRQTIHPKPDPFRIEGGVVEDTVSGIAQSVVNLAYLPFLFGIPLAGITCGWYFYHGASAEVAQLPYFKSVVVIYGISAIVELLSEPMFALAQYKLQYKLRAICESGALVARCIVTFMLTVSAREDTGALAFALGQLAYAVVLSGLYALLVWETTRGKENSVFPKRIWKEEISQSPWFYFHRMTLHLASTMWLQTVFKHILTEGDKLLSGYYITISEQGLYALVANYGSLIARLVFSPIEETIRTLFSKLLAPPLTAKNFHLSSDTFTTITRIYVYISMLAVIFGPKFAQFLLPLIIGSQWLEASSSSSSVISGFSYYIPLLAFNGILEAFVQSISTPRIVREQSILMLVLSLVFAIAGYIFIRIFNLGAAGLVYANMVNLTIRIVACIYWVSDYYSMEQANLPDVVDEKRAAAASGRQRASLFPLARRDAYPSLRVAIVSGCIVVGVFVLGPINSLQKFAILSAEAILFVFVVALDETSLILQALDLVMPSDKHTRRRATSSTSSIIDTTRQNISEEQKNE
ncbi:Rft protein-domain-containing protein [Lipomyces oligophaga]|uniref:Rft protein-domain-containing protein n=1 Tax=Lipomyces oligophaga TaxID=45792 RepID=UPI0034CD8AE3